MDDAELELAQAQAMELLLHQCVSAPGAGDAHHNEEANANILDFLAQTCQEASAVVQGLKVEDVAEKLAEAVTATQASLREVQASARAILDDPDKVRELSGHLQRADARIMEAIQESSRDMIEAGDDSKVGNLLTTVAQGGELATYSDEASVRNMMALTDNMCGTMNHALSTITKDELDLAAQLSLGIAQKLLEAGQTLFLSLSDEERRKARRRTRGDRILIEEVGSDDETEAEDASDPVEKERQAVLRKRVEEMMAQARDGATEHPFLAGALTAAGLPFVGLAIPVASIVGVGLVLEKYYPEHTNLAVELAANFIQMAKLWFLLLKIGARQLAVVARDCFVSWHEYASKHGYMATGLELASTGCSLSFLAVKYLYEAATSYLTRA